MHMQSLTKVPVFRFQGFHGLIIYIGTCTVPLQSQYAHSLTKVLVFRFSKFSWPYNYNKYMYMITCTNMYSATAVTVYTQSLQRYWFFRFSRFSWSYRYSANTVCTQRYWFSGFKVFMALHYTH